MKSQKLYDYPRYYEIAFLNRDITREVDVFQQCIQQFSGIPVDIVLEIGCGPALHMIELMKRGYDYIGIDINKNMIQAAQKKANDADLQSIILKKDMVDFTLEKPVDFIFILLGSLLCQNSGEIISHFRSVGKVLKPGGLYFLDWCVLFDRAMTFSESWEASKDNIQINASYSRRFIDLVGQRFQEIIKLNVKDSGDFLIFEEKNIRRAIYPQEFILLMEKIGIFEFVGWWNNWDISDPLKEDILEKRSSRIRRPIVVIRKKCKNITEV